MSLAIECNNLHVRYGTRRKPGVEAVNDLSFTVEPGEVVGFLGQNGAGKSSTIKVIMGFVAPTTGACNVFGQPSGSLEAKRVVGYLPEVAMYYPYLTPVETLTLYGELQGLRGSSLKTEVMHLLEVVGLTTALSKQNRQLSKGMLQRVGIAQSLLGNPKLLVLDEPTSGLDPIGRHELREILRQRQANGTTIFFSSHELSEVGSLCDRLLFIKQGHLIEERNVEDLRERLWRFEIKYTGATSLLGLTEVWEETDNGVYQAQLISRHALVEAIARVQASGGRILDVVSQEGSLEDYFISTVKGVA